MPSNDAMEVIEPGSFSEWIWQEKYRFRDEPTVDDTFRRVATSLASVETEAVREEWALKFYDVMRNFHFLPGGRIIAGAGTGRDVTFANCFVMPRIDDSLSGIMQAVTEAAMTLRSGGGVGMDFSTIRPRGARVKGLDADASGPVSFMALWDTMCSTIMSAGARRGAMMGVLRCDHPDIEEFVTAKRAGGRLTNFNISVAVTADFMRAVENDTEFPLVFGGQVHRTIRAAELWNLITRTTYETADPGILFIDRANETNPLRYAETLYATNPCAEQWLPPGGACLLGSINLAQLVRHPFTPRAAIRSTEMADIAIIAVRMMDNVNDVSAYPLPIQKKEAQQKRRVGLGVTGLADALIMCGIRYGSKEAVRFTDRCLELIKNAATDASHSIGKEKGSFPLFDSAQFNGGSANIYRRNSHLTSIQPTGTTSILAGNVSSGIEPVFDWSYRRNVLQRDGTKRAVDVEDYVVRLARHMGVERKGSAWITANDLSVDEHLAMVAVAQKHVDSAISKTINCPASMSFEDFKGVYTKAYAMGLKGCTTFRPNDVTGSILVRNDEPAKPAASAEQPSNVVQIGEPLARAEVLRGSTYKIAPGGGLEHGIYVTINDTMLHGRPVPFEIFVNTKAIDAYPWIVALTRMISAVWRKGGEVAFVAEELRQVFDPRGGFWLSGQHVPSICAAIGDIIGKHLADLGQVTEVTPARRRHCPKCQTGALESREGCLSCTSCDYTKCG